MPLFVPILRLVMLFLNIYDSYKTLKDPVPSTRNGGRPTVRAISQRKRDIKGCLAVWVVWCCLTMYERMLEGLICLFIPFYAEVKSLVLLFLIFTRARGAEPIYLHLVRPIIKPYTRTLDATLELLLMVGDFVFALATYPLHLALEWWHKRFGAYYEPLETEQDTPGGSSDADTSEVPISFFGSSSRAATTQLPSKVTSEILQPQLPNGAPSGPHTPNRKPETSSSPSPRRETRRQCTISSSQKDSKAATSAKSSMVNSANTESTGHRKGGEPSSRHQIWHPPRSSYIDDSEDQADLTLRSSDPSALSKDSQSPQEAIIAHEQKELDEWRQYPPFPSAYPPTPLVVTSRLAAASIVRSSIIYPAIQEERTQQDFLKSLLPPREPLNPSPAGDSSDQPFIFGNSPYRFAYQATTTDEADDSASNDDYEDEDEFNMTLRTPLPPLGSLRSLPRRLVPLASGSSAVSMPSRLSTLTKADDSSSLRTRTSSDSLAALSSKSTPVSVIGKKRSYPRTKSINVKNRVRQIEDRSPDGIADPDLLAILPSETRRRPNAIENPDTSDTVDDPESSPKSSFEEPQDKDEIPPEKRRRVTRSSARAVPASRPNIKRHIPSPPQTRKGKDTVTTKRLTLRMKSGSRVHPVVGNTSSSSASASASASDSPPPPVPPKRDTRLTKRRMT